MERLEQACATLGAAARIRFLNATRPNCQLVRVQPPYIVTNAPVYGLTSSQVYFLPEGLVVWKQSSYKVIPYNALKVAVTIRDVLEFGSAPTDAEVLGYTWLHTKQDGSPDRRYKNNPLGSVVRYATLNLSCPSASFELSLMVSNVACARGFAHVLAGLYGAEVSDSTPSATGWRQQGSTGHTERKGQGQGSGGARTRRVHESPPRAATPRQAWQILGVARNASMEEVRVAYRRLAQQYHPDKVAHLAPEFQELAERRMREINSAYEQMQNR